MLSPDGFAQMIWRGKIYYKEAKKRKGCSSIIMDQLGSSLSDLFYQQNKHFSLKTTLMLADQMIKRLEQLHSQGILHRDIKPGNFVMGVGENKHKVYLIDFGLANFYRNSDGSHMEYRTDAPFRGTHRYASINAHFKVEQSRRDDLEGLGYVLLYFMRGGLPWQNVNCSRRKRRKMIGDAKKGCALEDLCQGLPAEFREYMETVRSLQFDSEPPYRLLRKIFKRCFRREGYKRDYTYDWTREEPTTPSGSTIDAQQLHQRAQSESSLSTMEDDGVARARYEPATLKRHREPEEASEEPPHKRARTEANAAAPVHVISSHEDAAQQAAALALGGLAQPAHTFI